MKTLTVWIMLIFCPFLMIGQEVDSVYIKQVDSLIQVSRTLTGQKDFDKALEVNAEAEKTALERLGRESAAYGNCCSNRGRIFYIKGDFLGSEKWYLECKGIREKVFGKDHPSYASCLSNLGLVYRDLKQFQKAEQLQLEAKAIREKVLGKEHPDYLHSLNSLATLHLDVGQYDKAEQMYLECKDLREKVLGKEHPDYAQSLGNLAVLYWRIGEYEKAEPLYLEALSIIGKSLGKKHPFYIYYLNNLSSLYLAMGQYEKAEPLYLECKAVREQILGREHPDYAASLNNLAVLYRVLGQYEKAEPLLLESQSIREKIIGKEHPDYAQSLNNLAILYRVMGQYEKAERLYLEAKAINEKALGKEHPDYALSLNNLASLYINKGQYEKAEALYLEAKAIWEKVVGKDHPDYVATLNNLASLYMDKGQYEKAEALFLEAKDIREKVLGKEHPDYASSLKNLASLYGNIGQYVKAEPLYLEAKAIWEKVVGKDHPDYAECLNDLAVLYQDVGQFNKATPCFLELSTVNKRLLEKAMGHLSENELNNFIRLFSERQERTLYFAQVSRGQNLAPACYDNSLFYKGFLLNAANRIKHMAMTDSSSKKKYDLLKSLERRLANEYSKPISERKGVEELEDKANTLEKDLARTVAGFGEAMRQVSWKEVQTSLKEGEAAIEYVHYKYHDKKATDSTMYAALILRKEMSAPVFIPLFEQRSLDSLLKSQNERKADYVNHLYTLSDRGAQTVNQPEKTLYELLWKPLAKELEGVRTVYYSPSGLLHRLNLGAIPINPEETLADRYNFMGMNSTRQLVIPSTTPSAGNEVVLYGGLRYEADTTENIVEPTLASRSRGELSFGIVDSTLRGDNWNYLPGTEKEVKTISQIISGAGMHPVLKIDQKGNEAEFKKIGSESSSPRILHIATHGYFFPDVANNKFRNQNNANESVFKMSEHPMLRSGLILSSGNAGWKGEKRLDGKEDGVLTAYEISQMNLSNTELVVLSACETGLGDIQGNEGVYGLQRAFKIAGVKYIIMSLWQVPDKQTSMLMTTFYKKWLEDKMTIPDAFHAAQKELRELGFDPYQWAGFVLIE